MKRLSLIGLLAGVVGLTGPGRADPVADVAVEPAHRDDRMDWWRDARFGLFIHWGLYSTLEGEYAGSTSHAEWIRTTAQIPVEEYDKLLERFNPVKFDADAWCEMAKDAGMKYIVITSKHHDGFALFDSAVSDFDVMSTPFQRDIMKELADAAQRHGLKMCWYHSIMDWRHPDYLPRRGWEAADRPADGANFNDFREYLHSQVAELLTNYGPVGVMWFDGEWEATWDREMGNALYEHCRRLQPDVIVNNRVSKGRADMAGMTTGPGFAGDFGTPEQEVPGTGFPGVDWESCITMNRHWGWNKADTQWKSETELIRMLIDIASKGGNLLLNVGPKPDGAFPDKAVTRLAAIGDWMDINAEAIYDTDASPFSDLPWGRCTMRDNHNRHLATTTLYLHVFEWLDDGSLTVPSLGSEPIGARILGSDESVSIERRAGDLVLTLPNNPVHDASTTIALEIDGRPIVYETPTIEAISDIFVHDLRIALATRSPDLTIHYTTDGSPPTIESPIYDAPFTINTTTTVRAAAAHGGNIVSAIADTRFGKVAPWRQADSRRTMPGVIRRSYPGTFDTLPDLSSMDHETSVTAPAIALGDLAGTEHVVLEFETYFIAPAEDLYTFALASDDGSRLTIDGRTVIDNDGLHGLTEKRGVAPLARGLHKIKVEWFNKTGGAELQLRVARPSESLHEIPARQFRYDNLMAEK